MVQGIEGDTFGRCVLPVMQVAQHLLGCSESLGSVTQYVMSIYSENCQANKLTEIAVRNMIIDLAARKSFAAKDSEEFLLTETCICYLQPEMLRLLDLYTVYYHSEDSSMHM